MWECQVLQVNFKFWSLHWSLDNEFLRKFGPMIIPYYIIRLLNFFGFLSPESLVSGTREGQGFLGRKGPFLTSFPHGVTVIFFFSGA